jgi:Fe-S-cluster containining protein
MSGHTTRQAPFAQDTSRKSETETGNNMKCHQGCAACCIAPSISSVIPGMEQGKRAGIRCVQLSGDNHCLIFGSNLRPKVCSSLQPSPGMCGVSAVEALETLADWERRTCPRD